MCITSYEFETGATVGQSDEGRNAERHSGSERRRPAAWAARGYHCYHLKRAGEPSVSANNNHSAYENGNRERLLARLSRLAADWTGSSTAFWFAVSVVVLWLVSGPYFGFSDTWQLVINTGTTIVTFLMVFL